MLISPPFLPPRLQLSEDAWLDTAMSGGEPGSGSFPVSYVTDPQGGTHALDWHGGLHLTAPMGPSNAALPVRAIADGTIVYVRQRTSAGSPDHPLNYGPGYTSDAVVVIKHETDIGADSAGTATKVAFYSVYLHLHSIAPNVRKGNSIYRKDEIGQAGHVYGKPNVMHFEICCDDANLALLVGRSTGLLKTNVDGRTDAVYGEMYFHVPAGAEIFAQQPLPNSAQAMAEPMLVHGRGHARGAPQALQVVYTTTEDLVVGIRYAGGEGAVGERGDAHVTTYRLDGTTIGDPLPESEAEYDLYKSAMRISAAYPANNRPAPSAVYELLRFGRILGPDALTPADVPHWRKLNYPGGLGWINLNTPYVHKFSDADFPHWKGWKLIDDDTDGDARCESSLLRAVFYSDGTNRLVPNMQHAMSQLRSTEVQRRLKRTICKFPSEWDVSTIDQRWSWLMVNSDENPVPLTADDYTRFKAHVSAICFDCPEVFKAQWCFEPPEFVRQFRLCGWLSEREMLQCIPEAFESNDKRGAPILRRTVSLADAKRRLQARGNSTLMSMLRKYLIQRNRLAHFLSQLYQETGVLQWSQELGNGREYEGRSDLGNTQPGDGVRFKGRGLIQTTGRSNYAKYSNYRGKIGESSYTIEPNNERLASEPFIVADTAGLFWISRDIAPRNCGISRLADHGISETSLREVTAKVNGSEDGLRTGLVARRSHLKVTSSVLLDNLSTIYPETVRRNV